FLLAEKQESYSLLQKKIKIIRDFQKQFAETGELLNKKQQDLLKSEASFLVREEQLKNLELSKKRLQEEQHNINEKIVLAATSAARFLSKYDVAFIENELAFAETKLTERSALYQASLQQKQEQELTQATLQSEQENAVKKVNELLDHKRMLQLQVDTEQKIVTEKDTARKTIFGDKDPSAERKRMNNALQNLKTQAEGLEALVKDKQEKIKVLEGKLEEWKKSFSDSLNKSEQLTAILLSKLNAAGIRSMDELLSNILEADKAQTILEIQQTITSNITTTEGILNSTDDELRQEIAMALTTDSAEMLRQGATDNEQKVSELNQQIGGLQKILEQDASDALKYQQIVQQAVTQQKEFDRWNKLCALIGSADGNKFSRFAQGLTLARLTVLANRHLKKFSDRYQVLKSTEKDLELQIVDAYQADVVRPMTTLSGGESFLVSLALALGLSDLAGHKVQIQSLFIDEGFGTLDAETLDTAISALENLQVSGKMIGIISHVEALKERIGTQIEVTKQPGGYSKIAIKSYGRVITDV
ncbi:MAG: SbcC/MukB-like Walker B domain-containing protein, partial [Ferruginibacter sp.]